MSASILLCCANFRRRVCCRQSIHNSHKLCKNYFAVFVKHAVLGRLAAEVALSIATDIDNNKPCTTSTATKYNKNG